MRMMARFTIPTESGNELIKSGKLNDSFEKLMADLKPEAAYFFPDVNGLRSGLVFFDLGSSSDIVKVVESFALGLGAQCRLQPVMTAEDIQQGFGALQGVIERFGS
ncbi:MAG: hypothetical protein JO352_25965 [Chloroflexi bacterium]|nr:hypothetical protein [Chloroflexota bacterium]MBV9599503.1 hypothetical protein [Chloroflexota bacterium]